MHERRKHIRHDREGFKRGAGFGSSERGRIVGTGNPKCGRERWYERHFPVPYDRKRCRTCKGRTMVSALALHVYEVTGHVVLQKAIVCPTCDGTGGVRPAYRRGKRQHSGTEVLAAFGSPPVQIADIEAGIEDHS